METDIRLIEDLTWHLHQSYIYYTNTNNTPVIRLSMRGNALWYEYYSFTDHLWHDGGAITPVDPVGPIQRVPATGSSYLQFTPTAIQLFVQDAIVSTFA